MVGRWLKSIALAAIGFHSLLLLGVSAMSIFDSGILWQDEKYVAQWIDTKDNLTIDLKMPGGGALERIGPEVVAVASNDKYLTARVRIIGSTKEIYYYLDKVADDGMKNGPEVAIGPMNREEFEAARAQLDMPEPVDF